MNIHIKCTENYFYLIKSYKIKMFYFNRGVERTAWETLNYSLSSLRGRPSFILNSQIGIDMSFDDD